MRIFVADKTDNKMKQLTQKQLEQVYREHPEWRTEIRVGRWYKWPDNDNFLFCVTELIDTKYARGFGWDMNGEWHDAADKGVWGANNVIPATHKEVESALIAEAKRRYSDGDKVEKIQGVWISKSNNMFIREVESTFLSSDGNLWVLSTNNYHICLFIRGKWATVITPGNDISADIQALKDKYPNYNWTIIAEAKQ